MDVLGAANLRRATAQNTQATESALEEQTGKTSVKMTGLGHLPGSQLRWP